MFLHLGGGIVVPAEEVLFILDLKTSKSAKATQNFINNLEEEGFLTRVEDGPPKSLTVTDDRAYLSPISAPTLKNRLGVSGAAAQL